MVKIKRSRQGDKYIILKTPSGMHISVHRSGHVHLKDEKFHVDIEGIRKFYLSSPKLEEILQKKDTLVCRPCERYPDCICLDLLLNPELIEHKSYGDVCLNLQKLVGGGPCPFYDGVLCIWRGFCVGGLDPSPYARDLIRIRKTDSEL
jgi:hypothetical protein